LRGYKIAIREYEIAIREYGSLDHRQVDNTLKFLGAPIRTLLMPQQIDTSSTKLYVAIHHKGSPRDSRLARWRMTTAARFPLVCRQIHDETATLFYELNTFNFCSKKCICSFSKFRTPAQVGAIRSIEYCAEHERCFDPALNFSSVFPKLKKLYLPACEKRHFDAVVEHLRRREKNDLLIINDYNWFFSCKGN
jgi:hypothetical protein